MISISAFRQLADETPAPMPPLSGDLPAVYAAVGLPRGSSYSLQTAREHLASEIRKLSLWDSRAMMRELRLIRDGIITEYVLELKELQPYLSLLSAVDGSIRAEHPGIRIGPIDWRLMLWLAKMLVSLSPQSYVLDERHLRDSFRRPFAVADASRFLREQGFRCTVENGRGIMDESERRRVVAELEARIATLGGINVIATLFGSISTNYSQRMQRYLFGGRFDMFLQARGPDLPIGFLIHLSGKHLEAPASQPTDAQGIYNEICSIGTAFASHHDVQPYSAWELIINNVFTLQSLVVDLAQYDLLYRFQQFRPSDLREAIEGVFGWVPASLETALGWTVKNAATVAETIFGAGAMNLRPRIIKTAEILPQCNSIPGEEIQAILRTLTHAETPNKDYVLPEAGKALTLTSKPLVEKSDDTLILLNASFCAPAVFEALAMPISKKDKHAFSKIGTAAETYLRGKIEAKGVIVSRGEYRIGEHRGECDAVIETSDTIIFLELKIKSLTRMARAGWDLDIFADLASSLFAATEQLGRHEIAIRENGILSLKRQDGDVTTILLGHRNIEKVALTFSDFGSFQDRNILTQLFETLLNTHLNANDPAMQPKLEELNELIVAIRKQTVRLAELVPEAKEHPFFNCWFLSVGQLLVLLDEVSSAETFKTELWRCRHLSTSSLDWYSEFDAALRIGAAKPDP